MKKKLMTTAYLIEWVIIMMILSSPSLAVLSYQETYNSSEGTIRILVIVNSSIYDALYDPSLKQYIEDLEAEDYKVTLVKYEKGTSQELKDYFKLFEGLKGVIFIGDLPVPYFEIENDFGGYGYQKFPIDLFYMDLDGIWEDEDNNGIYDTHTGNLSPEIWLGRLTASPLQVPSMDEIALLRNYFNKNYTYRRGNFSIKHRGLYYPDDDWSHMFGHLDKAYSDVTVINDKTTTTAPDYKNRLKENYEWIHVCVHSSPRSHWFGGGANSEVPWRDIHKIDPVTLFYNLFACSNCEYTISNYMGGHYIFAKTHGLAAVGSTKIGSMLFFDNFYTPLGRESRENLGEAFRRWFSKIEFNSMIWKSWFYGMTVLGDPTLSLDPPIASIDSKPSSPIPHGNQVKFTGSGKIRQGEIIAYSWRSSKDGFLSSDSSFSTSSLSQGVHTIYFKVKDDKDRWSSEATTTLTVDNTPPTTPVVSDEGKFTNNSNQLYAKWSATDAESGIAEYQYRITKDSATGEMIKDWSSAGKDKEVTVTGLNLEDGKTYYFSIKAKNGVGLWSEIGFSDGITVDITPPTIPKITVRPFTNSRTTLITTCLSSDPESGIVQYLYAIGTSRGKTDVVGWTGISGVDINVKPTYIIHKNLKLQETKTYYFAVKAKNEAGSWSETGFSDGITVDISPPLTSDSGIDGNWCNSPVTVTLTASDSISGVDKTYYSTDGSNPAIVYTEPFSISGDGVYTIKYYSTDKAGNSESIKTAANQVKIDTTPPTTPLVTDEGRYTNKATQLSAKWSSDDFESGVAEYQYRITKDSATGEMIKDWSSAGKDKEVTVTGLNLEDGKIYYFAVKAKNEAGSWSETGFSDGITVDISLPLTSDSGIDGNWCNSPVTVTLTASDSISGVDKTYYSTDGSNPAIVYTEPFTISSDGVYTIKYYSTDKAGNSESIKTAANQVKIDTTPPIGSIKINNDAPYTISTQVILSLSATDKIGDLDKMWLSNDNVNWSQPEPYATTQSWTLTEGKGLKTVYVKFSDKAGNWSEVASDTIILKETGNLRGRTYEIRQIRRGRWTRHTGVPLSNVNIKLTGEGITYTITSDGNGYYRISSLPEGNYTAVASKSGYTSDSKQITITAGRTIQCNFLLKKTGVGNLTGRTYERTRHTGVPLSNVDIKLTGEGITYTITSDGNGYYRINGLPEGRYKAVASKPGYTSYFKVIIIRRNRTTWGNFFLRKRR